MVKQIIFLITLVSVTFSGIPLEPAKRSLYVLQHGLGDDSKGHVARNCEQWGGTAFTTWSAKGLSAYLIDTVLNSFLKYVFTEFESSGVFS